ncbi:MAG: carbonic anhydrase [Gammaproteobacteria bacterium]|jgi:carbonic anhydrase/acetyltransferase-like protein (isoleucine patch superfamily)|nr:carbonic anhydrase [Gammaproteobacteria bacterium]
MKNIREFNGHSPKLGKGVFIDPSAVVTGQVSIGDDSSVWPCVSIRGDLLGISIGRATNIQDGSVLHTTQDSIYNPGGQPLIIGDEVTIGHNATVHACTIHDQVLIGMGAVILDGAIIESKVLVAAGSLVSPGKVLTSGYLWRGNPARPVRELSPQELEFFKFSADGYVRSKNLHLQSIQGLK